MPIIKPLRDLLYARLCPIYSSCAQHGIFESQPKQEDAETLDVLIRLTHRLAEQNLKEAGVEIDQEEQSGHELPTEPQVDDKQA
jgi:hypothetical protein